MSKEFYQILNCPMIKNKNDTGIALSNISCEEDKNIKKKINLIWLETNGCAGNIISLMNGENPDIAFLFNKMVNLKYSNSLMQKEGENAFEEFINTLNTEYILVVEGAISTRDDGKYTIIARYKDRYITSLDAVKLAGEKAKYILAVGTCASYGGISSAMPNPSGCLSVDKILTDKKVINIPGCPGHPDWVMGTIANLIYFGMPELDEENRPVMFYGITIHDLCSRRSYFNKGIFADKLGQETCMIKLGCRGPRTKTDCPIRQWNNINNWPVEDNSPCIGCANKEFPGNTFVKYND